MYLRERERGESDPMWLAEIKMAYGKMVRIPAIFFNTFWNKRWSPVYTVLAGVLAGKVAHTTAVIVYETNILHYLLTKLSLVRKVSSNNEGDKLTNHYLMIKHLQMKF